MQDNITNAHRLIGETIREPGDERRGRIVGVDQARVVPVIFVIWHEQPGIQRVELARGELRQLADACARASAVDDGASGERGRKRDSAPSTGEASSMPALNRRRVGSR